MRLTPTEEGGARIIIPSHLTPPSIPQPLPSKSRKAHETAADQEHRHRLGEGITEGARGGGCCHGNEGDYKQGRQGELVHVRDHYTRRSERRERPPPLGVTKIVLTKSSRLPGQVRRVSAVAVLYQLVCHFSGRSGLAPRKSIFLAISIYYVVLWQVRAASVTMYSSRLGGGSVKIFSLSGVSSCHRHILMLLSPVDRSDKGECTYASPNREGFVMSLLVLPPGGR